jgi:hypothetical protein
MQGIVANPRTTVQEATVIAIDLTIVPCSPLRWTERSGDIPNALFEKNTIYL